ncbi:MAG: hypothetical protein ACEQSK_15790, partial [Sphingomonadaceae bacterium]
MRRSSATPPAPDPNATPRSDMATLKTLFPYLWVYKWRVLLALGCLVGAKLANVGVPLVMKRLIDSLSVSPSHPQALLVLPLGALVARLVVAKARVDERRVPPRDAEENP